MKSTTLNIRPASQASWERSFVFLARLKWFLECSLVASFIALYRFFILSKGLTLYILSAGPNRPLSIALGLQALGYEKKVLFTKVWNIISTLQQSRADFSYHKRMQSCLKPDLLILDELGYKSMAESTVEDFFEIVSQRYEKGSPIIITSNRLIAQ